MNSFESRLSAGLGKTTAGSFQLSVGQSSTGQCSVGQHSAVFLAAVSGGADSTAMLVALAELRRNYIPQEAGFILHCVHVEHGIRPADESRGDARAVEALCEKLKVPFRLVTVPPGRIAAFACNGGPGIEGAARIFRRRAWNREARRIGADFILTAHTRDDLLETLLMRILRGSGPAGLAAMPRSRGRILRPLLDLTRQDVLSYLEERGIPYRTDSTNADIRFMRNRVRHKLVPLLDEFFPSWRSSLLALAETQSLTARFLASEVREKLPWECLFNGGGKTGELRGEPFLRLSEADFLKAPPILREEAIFAGVDMLAALVKAGGRTAVGRIAVGRIADGNTRRKKPPRYVPVPRRAVVRRSVEMEAALANDLGPVRLRRQNDFIEMTPVRRPLGADGRGPGQRGFSLLIKEAGFYTLKGRVFGLGKPDLHVRAGVAEAENRSGTFSAGFPLVLRNLRESDRIFKGGHWRRFSDILDTDLCSGYAGKITAEDAEGNAAFICIKRSGELLLVCRDAVKGTSLFEVSGGTDV